MTVPANIHLVIGLGNPGKQYERTRHNIGFMVLDELARRHRAEFHRKFRFHALLSEISLQPSDASRSTIFLAKPQTFMNLSGGSVRAIAHWHKVEIPEMLVVVDDADLPLGVLRLRESGGSGGQKGLESIIQHLGSQDFPRLRIGIGRPPAEHVDADLVSHVLEPFSKAEIALVESTIKRAADAVECVLTNGIAAAMNEYNRKL